MNSSKPYSPAASGTRQVEDIRVALFSSRFPLTPALSLGERVNRYVHGEQSRQLGFALRGARCSLSLWERVRVRGNGASDPLGRRTIPGTVEVHDSSGVAGGFPKRK